MPTTTEPQPYIGDTLNQCLDEMFDWTNTYAVVVSGASWNPCGHMLLNTGGYWGWYFHIAERKGSPRFMARTRLSALSARIQEAGTSANPGPHPEPPGAQRKLDELLAQQWFWFVLPNNCASFLEDVVRVGGSSVGLYLNCPTLERFPE